MYHILRSQISHMYSLLYILNYWQCIKCLCSAALIDGNNLTETTSDSPELLNINAWVKSPLKTCTENGTGLAQT